MKLKLNLEVETEVLEEILSDVFLDTLINQGVPSTPSMSLASALLQAAAVGEVEARWGVKNEDGSEGPMEVWLTARVEGDPWPEEKMPEALIGFKEFYQQAREGEKEPDNV